MSETLTIQGIDSETTSRLAEEANRRGMSINTLVLQMIEKRLRIAREYTSGGVFHDLDDLAGTWSDAEYSDFMRTTADFERVDEDLWR